MRMLDLFCGRGGWTNAFLERGWECVGVDLVKHPEYRGDFIYADILNLGSGDMLFKNADFICASSPCEQFSVHGMKNFHPDPPYPALGIELFSHTRLICEASCKPYVMENVRAAQNFVGKARHHCGPYYLWGNAVPPLMAQGVTKGISIGNGKDARKARAEGRLTEYRVPYKKWNARNKVKAAAEVATIPPELAACVADYAERICGAVDLR